MHFSLSKIKYASCVRNNYGHHNASKHLLVKLFVDPREKFTENIAKVIDATVVVDVDQAVNVFSQLQQVDPYRLDNMDTYSNLLYVKVRYLDYFLFCH